jgi:hypothetical protein
MYVAEYVNKMQSLGDEMAAAGRIIEEEELVEYILAALAKSMTQLCLLSSPRGYCMCF